MCRRCVGRWRSWHQWRGSGLGRRCSRGWSGGEDPEGGEGGEPVAVKMSFLVAAGERSESVRGWLKRAIETYDGEEAGRPVLYDEGGEGGEGGVLGLVVGGRTEAVTRMAASAARGGVRVGLSS